MKILCDDKKGNKMLVVGDSLSFEYGKMKTLGYEKEIQGIWFCCLGTTDRYAIIRKDKNDMSKSEYDNLIENIYKINEYSVPTIYEMSECPFKVG